MTAILSAPAAPLAGDIVVPGDKSLSHRALMFGALAVGRTTITGLLEGEDVKHTAQAMAAFGAGVERRGAGTWQVQGVGIGGLAEPEDVLDLGNSGTAVRLLMGLAASQPMRTIFTGDASLRRRPMERVMAPLRRMGARFKAGNGGRLPVTVIGAETPMPIEFDMPVASAQLKSAVLLAGLNAPGDTAVIEPSPSRDHTENLLRHFGADITIGETDRGLRRVTVAGQPELTARDVAIPGDPSSAAFPAVAALLVPGSAVTIRNVGVNPLRTGLYDCLREMGADLRLENRREQQCEPVADLVVRASRLEGIEVPIARAPAMIDEYPILAVAAAFARGTTVMRGAAELRVKESDRIASMARGLAALGVAVEEAEDGLVVHGTGGAAPAVDGLAIGTEMDHRIAMSFLVYGMAARRAVAIDDGTMIDTSFPGFVALMNGLGGRIAPAGGHP